MIAVDTSALARFLNGLVDENTHQVAAALASDLIYLPSVVVTELFSNPDLTEEARVMILGLPLLRIKAGHWERAGLLRAAVKRHVLKANVADVLIAQSCIDHDIPLITYDRDFRHFVGAGLKLI